MTHAFSSAPSSALQTTRRETNVSPHRDRAHPRRRRPILREHQPLGRFTDSQGRLREVIAWPGAAGSVLVVDRDVITRGDRRLVAHLAADEPIENAALVCRHYLEDAHERRCRCRPVRTEDARTAPFPTHEEGLYLDADVVEPVDRSGCSYRVELTHTRMSIPELRWRRRRAGSAPHEAEPVSVREAVGALQSYEPVRMLTLRALRLHGGSDGVSTTVLRSELERVLGSPIVLNRRLREVVLAAVERQDLSMSEIARRCGRVKRDRKGNESGETSWLARRLGLLPEGGHCAPTPWVHSDVLALIARRGLGISPREAEAG